MNPPTNAPVTEAHRQLVTNIVNLTKYTNSQSCLEEAQQEVANHVAAEVEKATAKFTEDRYNLALLNETRDLRAQLATAQECRIGAHQALEATEAQLATANARADDNRRQIDMDTVRFREMQDAGFKCEADREVAQAQVRALQYKLGQAMAYVPEKYRTHLEEAWDKAIATEPKEDKPISP